MRPHFEYYIDDNFKENENTVLYGKAILIVSTKGHKLSWTPNQKRVYFYKDTMTYKELGKKYNLKEPTIHEIFVDAKKKLKKVVHKLVDDRRFFDCI